MRYSEQLIRSYLGSKCINDTVIQPPPENIPIMRMDIDETPPVDKKRCKKNGCKKKLGLTAFSCKCGLYFCVEHRPAEEHECTYNYKEAAKSQLSNVIIPVIKDKLERI